MQQNVFITGASGCVGQYLLDILIEDERYQLFLLLRNPDKLKQNLRNHPRVKIIQGSLIDTPVYLEYLQQADFLIHLATSWGGDPFEVNVEQSLRLMNSVSRERCKKILYFSTGSILGSDNQPREFAKYEGTEYVRSKYLCHERLPELDIYDRVTVLFPSLVMGASKDKPMSHVSSGIPQVVPWLNVIRFLKAEGSFHFIHAHDIGLVIHYLLGHDTEARELVLGNEMITFTGCIEQFCEFYGKKIYWQFELTQPLIDSIVKIFKIQMSPWDHSYIKDRHFNYKTVINPATFGLRTSYGTLAGILAEK